MKKNSKLKEEITVKLIETNSKIEDLKLIEAEEFIGSVIKDVLTKYESMENKSIEDKLNFLTSTKNELYHLASIYGKIKGSENLEEILNQFLSQVNSFKVNLLQGNEEIGFDRDKGDKALQELDGLLTSINEELDKKIGPENKEIINSIKRNIESLKFKSESLSKPIQDEVSLLSVMEARENLKLIFRDCFPFFVEDNAIGIKDDKNSIQEKIKQLSSAMREFDRKIEDFVEKQYNESSLEVKKAFDDLQALIGDFSIPSMQKRVFLHVVSSNGAGMLSKVNSFLNMLRVAKDDNFKNTQAPNSLTPHYSTADFRENFNTLRIDYTKYLSTCFSTSNLAEREHGGSFAELEEVMLNMIGQSYNTQPVTDAIGLGMSAFGIDPTPTKYVRREKTSLENEKMQSPYLLTAESSLVREGYRKHETYNSYFKNEWSSSNSKEFVLNWKGSIAVKKRDHSYRKTDYNHEIDLSAFKDKSDEAKKKILDYVQVLCASDSTTVDTYKAGGRKRQDLINLGLNENECDGLIKTAEGFKNEIERAFVSAFFTSSETRKI